MKKMSLVLFSVFALVASVAYAALPLGPEKEAPKTEAPKLFAVYDVPQLDEMQKSNYKEKQLHSYEFLRTKTMSAFYLHLNKGDKSAQQQPNAEDEIYYIVHGESQMMLNGKEFTVHAGSVIFVAKGVSHYFLNVTSSLDVLVLFAPPFTGVYKGEVMPGMWRPTPVPQKSKHK